MTKDEMRRI